MSTWKELLTKHELFKLVILIISILYISSGNYMKHTKIMCQNIRMERSQFTGIKITSFSKSYFLFTPNYFFEIWLKQPGIISYLPFSEWFRSKRTSIWIHINRKMLNTIWFQVDLIRFRKDFSVCSYISSYYFDWKLCWHDYCTMPEGRNMCAI